MYLKPYLIDTWTCVQKYCKQKWDLPQKPLQIEESGFYGLTIPRTPKGALFFEVPAYRGMRQATCTAMAGASVILQANKTIHRITESQNVRGWKGPLWVI